VVGTEVEALQLEYNWIKEFDPRFNVRYRDDKTYPMLAVTLNEEYPRVFVYRGPRRPGVRYFGPYSHAWAIRETVDLLTRVFGVRTCSKGVFRRSEQMGRPCLLGYIDKCSAPCVGRVSAAEHRQIVDDFCDFLSGKTDGLIRRLEREMTQAAEELDFERAARLRDDVSALRRAMEKQAVVLGSGTDADVIAMVGDELEASVKIFHVRDGRVRGERGWVVEIQENASLADQVGTFLTQFYGAESEMSSGIPREVLVPALPDDAPQVEQWLTQRRGAHVSLRVPQRGDKRTLMTTVELNATEALARHKLARAGDLTTRSAALTELQEALGLDVAPLRIECIDISHVQGTDVVASMVVFEDGLARKSDYRHYAIKEAAGDGHSDDVASIAEVTRRRFARYHEGAVVPPPENSGEVEADDERASRKAKRFAYPPNLFVVDGGAPQAHAAASVLDELGVADVAVVGLAKRLEEVWIPGDDEPVILPRNSEALFLLQRVRDEAHRFAITFHRSKRSKRMTASALDGIAGLGASRRTALVTHCGSVANLKRAAVDEIAEVKGIGPATAQAVYDALRADTADTAAGPDTAGPDTQLSETKEQVS
ncbi:excinuclease ABC subunit UvrC, partial [Gordonia sp. (in: high G+C Gram-positive bacteria)]|uniref:excinuclease ABC subunit UvrC n=1 Tax=Gordonia sp. (in: high G+C Gram-positive bacteria) TaxID=84139 RepID=UPI003C724865